MESLEITCTCGNRLRPPSSRAGKEIRCPRCGKNIQVPENVSDEIRLVREEIVPETSGPTDPAPPADFRRPRPWTPLMRQEIGRLKRICIRGFLALTVLLALVAAFPGVLLLRAHGEPADREIVVGSVVALGALAAVWLGVPWMLFARVARFRRLWRFGIRVEAEVEFCELTTRYSGLPLSRSHSATVLFEYEGRAYRRSFGGLEQAYPEAVYCVRQGRVQTNRGFVLVDAKKPARSILVPAAAWREAAK